MVADKRVAITIDDVPKTLKYEKDNFQPVLLNKIDSLKIPVTIFINEGQIYRNEHVEKNKELLEKWCANKLVTIGNHTRDHSRYSSTGFDEFTNDVKAGESLIFPLARKYRKKIKYFRFPFNDLGNGKDIHDDIYEFLKNRNYIVAPYTVESSDWMFNFLYTHYLKLGELDNAKEIGSIYVQKTIDTFSFFDSLATTKYKRNIKHIYLCHDNSLNADYLPKIISKLIDIGYDIIPMDEAMKDKIYTQEIHYHGKYGISWLYRWMDNSDTRKTLMRKEPDLSEYFEMYYSLQERKK